MIKHPSGQKRFQAVAARFLQLRADYEKSAQDMWAGKLALNFTTEELRMLKEYLSPRDMGLLGRIQNFICAHNDAEVEESEAVVRFPRSKATG